ncbi:NmrA family protein [Lophiostoma macrostomum CBS 122681]|uniref:NmrA family protein n=1 Tax=Lophiostoma macrostomum CBS 122681 TaxID=1314788 RepID=A0A6A6SVJ6_9PLEO|nr:NmrA family protein [Lophiostoma macrostomum CBS 122681]
METEIPTVFVTGATGHQGFSLSRQLRSLDWNVRTTVRNLQSHRASQLASFGVHLTPGDWDDEEALKAGIKGCSKLFLCLLPDIQDPTHERRQADTIIRIARSAGVSQVVSSTSLGVSMFGTRLEPGNMLYDLLVVKKQMEEIVRDAGFASCTFLRPAYFMNRFVAPAITMFAEILENGTWTTALKPDTQLGLVDHEDIAKIAVSVLRQPERYNDRDIGIVSEFLTPQTLLDKLGRAMGRTFRAKFLSEGEIDALPYGPVVLLKCDRSMRYMPECVDMKELVSIAHLTKFDDFLKREEGNVSSYVM